MTDSSDPPSIPTPPATTLSPRSPTPELAMPTTAPSRILQPLYLVVATSVSPPLGIGAYGTLPWPSLKNDMSFFSRVTQRASPGRYNAVIMGRRTWESIPEKLRPLRGRWNVIVSRQLNDSASSGSGEFSEKVTVARSLDGALEIVSKGLGEQQRPDKVFMIGGAEVYRAAVEMAERKGVGVRILQTLVRRKDGEGWNCDTFFPVDLDTDDTWKEASSRETSNWVGEEIGGEWCESGDKMAEIEIKLGGWEKE